MIRDKLIYILYSMHPVDFDVNTIIEQFFWRYFYLARPVVMFN